MFPKHSMGSLNAPATLGASIWNAFGQGNAFLNWRLHSVTMAFGVWWSGRCIDMPFRPLCWQESGELHQRAMHSAVKPGKGISTTLLTAQKSITSFRRRFREYTPCLSTRCYFRRKDQARSFSEHPSSRHLKICSKNKMAQEMPPTPQHLTLRTR